jgi:hypothetical protein
MRGDQILAPEIDVVRCLFLPFSREIGFDDAHVLVLDPLAAGGLNHAQIHGPSLSCFAGPCSNN